MSGHTRNPPACIDVFVPPVDMAAELRARCAIVTKPGDPGGYRGEYDCGDCCSMTHCETHGKDEGTYPFDEAPIYGGLDASLDRGPSTDIDPRLLPSTMDVGRPPRRVLR